MTKEKQTPFLVSLLRIGLFLAIVCSKMRDRCSKERTIKHALSSPQALKLQGCTLSPFSSAQLLTFASSSSVLDHRTFTLAT